jgi:hypothetical protein
LQRLNLANGLTAILTSRAYSQAPSAGRYPDVHLSHLDSEKS